MAKVKVGIVGCGVMGGFHTKVASELKEAKLIGVYDADQSKSQETADKFQTKSFESIEALCLEIESLIIASPTATHFEIAKNALEKGLHLLVEKPITLDSISAELLVSIAGKKKKLLAVGMIERFNPAFTKAFSIVKKEKILGFNIQRFSPFPERISDASVVWDVMIHDIDLALTLNKSGVDSIKADGKKIKSERLDEVTSTVFFKDGAIANISCSRAKNDKYRHLQITTERAIYDVDLLVKKVFKREFETLITKTEIETIPADQISLEQKDFYSSIENNRAPRCPASDAIAVMKIAEEVEVKCSSR